MRHVDELDRPAPPHQANPKASLPSLDAMADVARADIPAVFAHLAGLQAALLLRLVQEPVVQPATIQEKDELLTVEQVAQRLQVAPAWIYKNWKRKLRACARPMSSHILRFSSAGLERYLANLRGGG